MSKIVIIEEKDLVRQSVADKRFRVLHEEPGGNLQKESVKDAIFSIYGVESVDDLFKKNPELDVATVRNEISNAMEKEVDILGYS